MYRKLDCERVKTKEIKRATEDPVLIVQKKKNPRKDGPSQIGKISGPETTEKMNSKCYQTTESIPHSKGNDNSSRSNHKQRTAQLALDPKKIIKGEKRTKKEKIDLVKITKHSKNHFTDPEAEEMVKESTSFSDWLMNQVREAVQKLSNNKSPGPTKLPQKKSDPKTVIKTLNEVLRERDEKFTNGYKVQIFKPIKDGTKLDSYRPVNLLST